MDLRSGLLGVVGMLTFASFFCAANADVSVTPPKDWQASPENNSTSIAWFQNSTSSVFLITKTPAGGFPLFLIASVFAQAMAEMDLLESSDQVSFGQSNFGYRYFLNLTSMTQNLSSVMQNLSSTTIQIPFQLAGPMKMMVILSQKHGENYAVVLLTPSKNFDTVSNEIKPTLDSIKITKSPVDTETKWREYNSNLGVSLEYPSNWELNSSDNSMCDPVTGTCLSMILSTVPTYADILTLSQVAQEEFVNFSSGVELIKPVGISNYTIDGELAGEFTKQLTMPDTNLIVEQQNIIVIHNGKAYFLFFSSYPSEMSKPETKEIRDHIIKSIKWE